jgi:hypothetical protein
VYGSYGTGSAYIDAYGSDEYGYSEDYDTEVPAGTSSAAGRHSSPELVAAIRELAGAARQLTKVVEGLPAALARIAGGALARWEAASGPPGPAPPSAGTREPAPGGSSAEQRAPLATDRN